MKYPAGKIYFGSDQSSYDVKLGLKAKLMELGFLFIDLGTFDIDETVEDGVLAREVAEKVLENEDSCDPSEEHINTIHGCKSVGIILNETGVEILTAVSKMEGIVPALCSTVEMAVEARKSGVNLLCIGFDTVDAATAELIIKEFLS